MKRVILTSTFEYTDDEVDGRTDEELIRDSKEAFFLDGADLGARVETVDEGDAPEELR